MPDDIRFAILGAGMIADFHARAIEAAQGARLTACASRTFAKAKDLADKYGVAAEESLDALLARDDVDAVTVCTPSGAHLDLVVAAARAGKHVLCEKPLEVTPERIDRMIAACDEAGVILAGVFQSRTSKNISYIKNAIDNGRFGRLLIASCQIRWFRDQDYYDSGGWRGTWKLDGGGCLMNQGIHTVDLLCHLAGRPASVYALTETKTHERIEVEDTAVAALRFHNGAFGTIEASTSCAPGFPRRIEISGEKGGFVLDDNGVSRWEFVDMTEEDERFAEAGKNPQGLKGGSRDPKAITIDGHQRQIEDLADAIRQGRQPMISGREGKTAVEVVCAIYESSKTGKPVDL